MGSILAATLQPVFILRHLQHAAQAKCPSNSPRLHTTSIDFKHSTGSPLGPRAPHLHVFLLAQHCKGSMLHSKVIYIVWFMPMRMIYAEDAFILVDAIHDQWS